ncbi:MAG: hypothetical protein FJ286_16830 [Planctomycetes bacterium]|nr:hypothetical protein [Planctomycetota bacterium]
MPINIEIKARLADIPATRALVEAIRDTPPQTWHQRDTFSQCSHGRLKLRETGERLAELIFYTRPNRLSAHLAGDFFSFPAAVASCG